MKLPQIMIILAGLSVLFPGGRTSAQEKADDGSRTMAVPATIRYLHHCGYAVETEKHFLVFDYWEPLEDPHGKSLSEGVVDPEQIGDRKVRIFVSHAHVDHWDERVLAWREQLEDVEFFFGWESSDAPGGHSLPAPRSSYSGDGIEVHTVNSHHSGVPEAAFLVEVDGLTIFHGGDYQGKAERGAPTRAEEDMRYLREAAGLGDAPIDLLFLGAWLGEGNRLILDGLRPRAVFPMHDGGQEAAYQEFAADCRREGVPYPVHCPARRGDAFIYRNGKVTSCGNGLKITFLSNAGFLVERGGRGVLIDALFGHLAEGRKPAPADPPPELYRQLITAEEPLDAVDLVLVTHSDLDHHHRETLRSFLRSSPRSKAVVPFAIGEHYAPVAPRMEVLWPGAGKTGSTTIDGIEVTAIGIKHIGSREANHQGYFVRLAGLTFLHLADVGGTDDRLAEQLDLCRGHVSAEIDVVFVPFWTVEDDEGYERIRDALRPRVIVAMHGYAQDRKQIAVSLAKWREATPPVVLFGESLETRSLPEE